MGVCGVLTAGVLTFSTAADAQTPDARTPDAQPRNDETTTAGSRAVQHSLDSLVRDDAFPGVLAAVQGTDGEVRDYTAGVGDIETGEDVPVDGHVRIGSNTKPFVATVVLQLVEEGKVELDAPIETYLPGLVRGEGIDGNHITVRQLLQHTSGLADYDEAIAGQLEDGLLGLVDLYVEPHELVELGLSSPALFPPGTGWSYSNTNYVLAGLLVQKVTGRPIGEQITERIIEPLGLEDTSWPHPGDRSIDGAHPSGYYAAAPGEEWVDVTESDTSFGWAAGALISTPMEVTEFFSALLDGELLSPAMLAEMTTTVPAPESSVRGDEAYGLGLATFALSCGGEAWGHGGDILGYETRNAVTTDGRAATVAVTALPTSLEAAEHVEDAVDTALCS